MEMIAIDLLGMAAGVISTLAFIPQVLKVWRSQSTRGISLGMYVLYTVGLILWGIYAWMIESWPLLMTEAVTACMTFYILVMKLKHMKEA